MHYLIKNARIILPDQVLENGWLLTEGTRIAAFGTGEPPGISSDALPGDCVVAFGTGEPSGCKMLQEAETAGMSPARAQVIDAGGRYLSPGFVDIHVHGGGGADFRDGMGDAYLQALRAHLRGGTTSILPTLSSCSRETMYKAFAAFDELKAHETEYADIPNLEGIHLEGPYFAPAQAGAQDPALIRLPDRAEYEDILLREPSIRRWAIACELPGALEMGDYLSKRGVSVSIGHSDATLKEAELAFEHGFHSVTHLYSGCSMLHRNGPYRECGVVEAAFLNDRMDVEIIGDGIHLPPDLLRLIVKCKDHDRIALITDCLRPGACKDVPEGTWMNDDLEGKRKVIIENGVAVMPDHKSFAGSIATMGRCVRTMLQHTDVTVPDAVKMASYNPARFVGIEKETGSIEAGKRADLLIFDDSIKISHIFVRGNRII